MGGGPTWKVLCGGQKVFMLKELIALSVPCSFQKPRFFYSQNIFRYRVATPYVSLQPAPPPVSITGPLGPLTGPVSCAMLGSDPRLVIVGVSGWL